MLNSNSQQIFQYLTRNSKGEKMWKIRMIEHCIRFPLIFQKMNERNWDYGCNWCNTKGSEKSVYHRSCPHWSHRRSVGCGLRYLFRCNSISFRRDDFSHWSDITFNFCIFCHDRNICTHQYYCYSVSRKAGIKNESCGGVCIWLVVIYSKRKK